jgi:hypothetical protein
MTLLLNVDEYYLKTSFPLVEFMNFHIVIPSPDRDDMNHAWLVFVTAHIGMRFERFHRTTLR